MTGLTRSMIYTGSGGLSVSQQIYNRFKAAGKPLGHGEIAIVDGAKDHYYQVHPLYGSQFGLVDLIDPAWMVCACSQPSKDIRLKLRKIPGR